MTEGSEQWVGQTVDGIFPLRQYLGGSDHSAVFLTEYGEGEPRKAAIKLIPADPAMSDSQLSNWNFAAQLSHPNLLRLLGTGKCTIESNNLLYLIMEFAEENLSEILPQRALTPEESRDMLLPVLDALEYLHGKGFVHGDLKPANILASGDRLKLSSDTISRIGELQISSRRSGVYDPPEAISGMLTPAADVWSLGTTLVEVMTQRLPDWQPGPHREPVVPANLPAPFQEIARQCLRLEPHRRIAIADIAARLSSRATAASASALGSAISPVVAQKQTSAAPPRSTASLPVPPRAAPRMQSGPRRPKPYREAGAKSRFIIPLTVGALAFAAILTVLPRLLTHRPGIQPAPAITPAITPDKTAGKTAVQKPAESRLSAKSKAQLKNEPAAFEAKKSAGPAAQPRSERTAQVAVPEAVKTTSEKALPSPGSSPAGTAASDEAAKPALDGIASAKGEVLDQVLPDVSDKARATISGRVRVGIKVRVDGAGAVSDAELDSPGPSKFFADLALKAAKKWVFTPPEVNGKSVASEWSLRFVFTQSDTRVTPVQTIP